jgi:hypothetical protein
MSKKLITTIALVVALATATGAAAFPASPQAPVFPPASPGACNMLHTSEQGLDGMMNDAQVFDIMIPFVVASLEAGCVHT